MSGPAPKPRNLRARTNKKSEAAELTHATAPVRIPAMPNPDKRKWHALTKRWWKDVWQSPMAARFLHTDTDGLGRLGVLIDNFYKGDFALAGEIRLQEARWGLTPLDRNRMDWSIASAAESKPIQQAPNRESATDPRKTLRAVK